MSFDNSKSLIPSRGLWQDLNSWFGIMTIPLLAVQVAMAVAVIAAVIQQLVG